MIKRIVRMRFREEEVENFLEVFESSKNKIRNFEGCRHLELWQHQDEPTEIYTYSIWDHPNALEKYRVSDLFKSTWAKTKPLFREKAKAWSVRLISTTTEI